MKYIECFGVESGPECSGFMGLDLSLTSTGFAYISDNAFEQEYYGAFKTKLKGHSRLKWILASIKEKIRESKPAVIVIEGFSFGSIGRGVTGLAELRGVVDAVIDDYIGEDEFARVIHVSPSSIKKFTTGYGRASKEDMVAAVNKELNLSLTLKENDAADALALALYGRHVFYKD